MKKKKFNFNGIVILFILLIIVSISTYFIPGGAYERIEVNGRTMVDGGSYHIVESNPANFFDLFKSIPSGLQEASTLIIMIFLIEGAIKVIESTGAIRAFIYLLRNKLGTNNDPIILIVISLFFGSLGAFPGMLEAVIPFAPLCIGIAISLGYDMLVGISISLVPIVVGWSAGVTNPWTTGIGQSIAELTMFSGLGFRFIGFVLFMVIAIAYTLRYANIIKNDPTKSILYNKDISHLNLEEDDDFAFTKNHLFVLIIFALTIVFIVYGSLKLNFNMIDMSAIYIIGGILSGLAYGYSPNEITDEIIEGGSSMYVAAIAIGMARGVSVLMTNSNIIDTVVHITASILQGRSPYINAVGMFFMQTIINFFIPSGSGQAVVTLPVLIPVSDLVGLNRQIAILAFQYGDGFSNLMYPTVGALIAVLSYSKVTFTEWIKYIWKYMLITFVGCIIVLLIAVQINYS